ncbi:hypothetical protein [Qipengyuania sp. JC766]|uniref:hypothetical protein n=1 Tax=Qipengyuania sp. JC766 TaxID=3232139 RepID=UPI00345B1B54
MTGEPQPGANASGAMPDDGASQGAATAGYDGPIPKPIRVGAGGPGTMSCQQSGVVAGLADADIEYLSVRDAPSTLVKERDRLEDGQEVFVCSTENGWNAVIYSGPANGATDCELRGTAEGERNYTGPCRQGWVDADYVTGKAG